MLNNLLSALPFMTPERANIWMVSFWPMLKAALSYTLPLTLLSFSAGMVIALAVAVIRIAPRQRLWHRALYYIARLYVSAIRGTPMLVQLFVIFYGLPSLGVTLNPFITATIAFSLNVGAYASEILRAALQSISKGQWEAGLSLGLTYSQALSHIILPQAFRVATPPLSNTFISLVKDTSLASLVLVVELFKIAQNTAARTYEFLLVYIEAGLMYWAFCLILGWVQGRIEARLNRGHQRM